MSPLEFKTEEVISHDTARNLLIRLVSTAARWQKDLIDVCHGDAAILAGLDGDIDLAELEETRLDAAEGSRATSLILGELMRYVEQQRAR